MFMNTEKSLNYDNINGLCKKREQQRILQVTGSSAPQLRYNCAKQNSQIVSNFRGCRVFKSRLVTSFIMDMVLQTSLFLTILVTESS